jgi:hypothetical protein
VPWDKRFAEPIVLEDGSKLATLQDAIAHLARLVPNAERDMPEILTAAELLTNAAAHSGPDRVRPHCYPAGDQSAGRVFDPSRKDTKWGRRKLKRDSQ